MSFRNRVQSGRIGMGVAGVLGCFVIGNLAVSGFGDLPATTPIQAEATSESGWTKARPFPIAVRSNRARFVAPSRGPQDRTLVIVSVLNRNSGQYPIQISARRAIHAEKPELMTESGVRLERTVPGVMLTAQPGAKGDPLEQRAFHLPVRDGDPASPGNYVAMNAQLLAFSPSLQIYVDPNDRGEIDPSTVRDIVQTFETQILPKSRSSIGVACDVDRDGRFTILMSGWLGHLADGHLSVDGYVRGADFEISQRPPISNHGDILYLNAALKSGPHLRTVMAHEYAHAVTYCRKALGSAGRDEEGWLDEAISHLAEDLHGFSRSNLTHRVEAFLAEPERYRLLVQDFAAADLIRSHGHRGGAYLFIRWCADHYGPDLMKRLVLSNRCGVANLEQATGKSFQALYREWSIDLYLSALDSSKTVVIPPRASRIVPDRPIERTILDATTSHYAIVDGSESGAVEVIVEGAPRSQLQVTAIPLPADYPKLDFRVALEAAADGSLGLAARIRQPDGRAVSILSLSWSTVCDDSRKSPRQTVLEGEALQKFLDPGFVTGSQWRQAKRIPIERAEVKGIHHLRLVSRDELGRIVVAWTELDS